ncbi:MAG: hypothetical protein JNM52_10715 [Betaproteobacteria bacterium]|nr:hypothetical protein [Betaproteobacteria bacterium]
MSAANWAVIYIGEEIMDVLNLKEIELVSGGEGEAAAVRENANTAERVCGKGNVASVSTTGFTCK